MIEIVQQKTHVSHGALHCSHWQQFDQKYHYTRTVTISGKH